MELIVYIYYCNVILILYIVYQSASPPDSIPSALLVFAKVTFEVVRVLDH